jgi:asparagine synthase (glutamine-hydrolysing)
MCGIVGYIGKGDKQILQKMTDCLEHRGPDDSGLFVHNKIGLGHRRLSIIDTTSGGHQPMMSQDENLVIVYNGEIYNFREIRNEIKNKINYPFTSESDTEVILATYQVYGLECFKKFNGMFAIALYDKEKNQLVLARDRLGQKPLYWGEFQGTFLFASELKAFHKHPSFKKEIDEVSLAKYFTFDYVPTPGTIFKNVYKLDPGSYLVYKNGEVERKEFWELGFASGSGISKDQALTKMDSLLSDSVNARLVSDVPLGIFLSGGLDSSTIAYYAQKNSQQKIKTFSIGFEEASFDESRYAKQVAKHLGTDHFNHVLSAKDSLGIIPKVADILDEPVGDYSILPTYLLSQFTRKHVTVALGGDGGDELFFGYQTFTAERILPLLDNPVSKLLLHLIKAVTPTSYTSFNIRFKITQLLQGLGSSPENRHQDWMGNRTTDFGLQTTDIYDDVDKYFKEVKNENRWDQLIYLYAKTYLMDQVLVKVDRASMANSLEVRAPFLDYHFVDFVNSLPYSYKFKGLQTKYLLKTLMKDKLPNNIIHRQKQGFGVPLGKWFTRELKPLLTDMLSEERIKSQEFLDPMVVAGIVRDHLENKKDNRKVLWNLLTFQLWYDKWMK